jgi:hypothetical protein
MTSTRHAGSRCPVCESPTKSDATSLPFCSSRCRTIDLGDWLDERYQIADEPSADGFAASSEDLH